MAQESAPSTAPVGPVDVKQDERLTEPTSMTDHDLSSIAVHWNGWALQAPASAHVSNNRCASVKAKLLTRCEDVPSLRVTNTEFDLTVTLGNRNLPAFKKALLAELSRAQLEATFIKDTATELEWTVRTPDDRLLHNFIVVRNVSGKTFTCFNEHEVGLESEELLRQHREICESLGRRSPSSA